MKYWIK